MCEPCTADTLLEAVRGLRLAEPDLGFKPLLAQLREQQPELGAATKEVREALAALKAESEAAAAPPAAAPLAAEEGSMPCSNAALSLACIGCLRLPSAMDDEREKHPICDMCRPFCFLNRSGSRSLFSKHLLVCVDRRSVFSWYEYLKSLYKEQGPKSRRSDSDLLTLHLFGGESPQ